MAFVRFRAPGGRRGFLDDDRPEIRAYLPDPGVVDTSADLRIKSKGSRSLTRVAEGFLLKHFYPRNAWRKLLHSAIPAPAGNAFRNHRALHEAGYPVPRPLASVVVRRPWPWYHESWFLLEMIEQTTNFRDRLVDERDLFGGSDPARLVPFGQAADLIAGLHRLGFFHQDLHAKNILFDARGEAWLIDLDGSVRLGKLWYPIFLLFRLLDLRRFTLSLRFWIRRTDRERFLRRYFDQFPRGRAERRWFGLLLRFTAIFSSQDDKVARRDRKAALSLGLRQPPG